MRKKKYSGLLLAVFLVASLSGCRTPNSNVDHIPEPLFDRELSEKFNFQLMREFLSWADRLAEEKAKQPEAQKAPSADQKGQAKGRVEASFQIEDMTDATKHFGELLASSFYCVKFFINSSYDTPVTIGSGTIKMPLLYITAMTPPEGESLNLLEQPTNPGKGFYVPFEETGHVYHVRQGFRVPMNFSSILDTLKFDQRHDPKSRVIEYLRSFGVIATAAIPFVSGSDYGEVLSVIQGPITEELADILLTDLFASLGYMNAHALHEEVTIPAHGSIAKYVFFPRGDIQGNWGMNLPTRIMSLDTRRDIELNGTVVLSQAPARMD